MSSRDFNWASWGGVRSCDPVLHHHYWSYAHHVINYIIITHIMWSSMTSLLLLQQLAFTSHDTHVTLINCYLQNTVDVWEPVSTCLVNPRSCSRVCSVGEREKISAMGVARLTCLPVSTALWYEPTGPSGFYKAELYLSSMKKKTSLETHPLVPFWWQSVQVQLLMMMS